MTPTLFGIDKIKFLPKPPVSEGETVKVSPLEYPVPPIETVAATAILFSIVRLTFAPEPLPDRVSKGASEYVAFEVYAAPAFVIVKSLPTPMEPTTLSSFPEKLA